MDATSCNDFTLSCRLRRDAPAGCLATQPGVWELRLRFAGDDEALKDWDRQQNYTQYTDADGRCSVLEATLQLHSDQHPDWRYLRVGFPCCCLEPGTADIALVLDCNGAALRLYADKRLMDENFPYGVLHWPVAAAVAECAAAVSELSLLRPGRRLPAPSAAPVGRAHYFTPAGHNSWVGDVVTFFHDGVFHLYYLLDRRHHRSKFGCGGHYFAHLSSRDLRQWTEHAPALAIDEQWETIGTGTPFVWSGRVYFAYGMHSSRMDASARESLRVQREFLSAHGHTGDFLFADLPGVPAGTLYAVSDDAVSFSKCDRAIHPCENPSIYALGDGRLLLFAGYGLEGTWLADHPGAWRCVNPSFPPSGAAAPMRNSSECQCYFSWHGYDYVLGGFSGLFVSTAGPMGPYRDLAAEGHDLYDGLGVPMVSPFTGDRRILAGWLPNCGWGGHLVLREVLQLTAGRLGMKWLPECLPLLAPAHILAELLAVGPESCRFDALPTGSFLLSLCLLPTTTSGRLALRLLGDDGRLCELQLDFARGRAQWHDHCPNGHFAPALPSARELCRQHPEVTAFSQLPNTPMHGQNFCREHMLAGAIPHELRVMVYADPKLGGVILDAEIAGQQTMITSRPGLWPRALELQAETAMRVSKLSVAPWQAATSSAPDAV